MKKTILGSLGVMAVLGTVAVIGTAPTFAATTGWQEVQVTVNSTVELSGSTSSETSLSPTVSGGVVSDAAGALSIRSNVNWKLQYQAVAGEYTDAGTTAGAGTFLDTTGFGTAGYEYAGADATALATKPSWGATFAVGGTGGTKAVTALTTAGLTNVATGVPTAEATVTPTYSAHTDTSIAPGTFYGTIYYSLSAL